MKFNHDQNSCLTNQLNVEYEGSNELVGDRALIADKRPFAEGSTVRVLADDCRVHAVPVGTEGTVINSDNASTEIEYEVNGIVQRTWLWNEELRLVNGWRREARG